MIHPIREVRLTLSPDPWPVAAEERARIETHWQEVVRRQPTLWNGRVLGTLAPGWPGGLSLDDGVLSGTTVEGDYASFLAWRDWGFPEIGIRNLFGSALVMSADGALLYGVMGGHTANGGRVYPPGGTLEPRDVGTDGLVDVLGSIERELHEETGLDGRTAREEGLFVLYDGPRISVGRLYRFDEVADRLQARIRSYLESQDEAERELDDVVILRGASDAEGDRFPPYAQMFAAHLTGR